MGQLLALLYGVSLPMFDLSASDIITAFTSYHEQQETFLSNINILQPSTAEHTSKGQNPLQQFPHSKSVTSLQLPHIK